MVRPRVFLDFSTGDAPTSRVVFELFSDIVPKTCENFRALCTGELGVSKISDIPLSYKGSTIHRSIADFMVQGGDFTRHNGKGGESIYGAPFADEDLTQEIDSEGLLVMANKGPDTNGSQWFVTLRSCPHLNGKHVVFGRVVFGYDTIVKISEVPVDGKDRPIQPVTVTHCGELELRKVTKPAAPLAPVRSRSLSSAGSDHDRKKRRRHSGSRSGTDEDEGREERSKPHKHSSGSKKDKSSKSKHKEKHKSSKSKSKRREASTSPINTGDVLREETLEELDARLEREENERIAEEKQRQLERIKMREPIVEASGGVTYKGRGRMKYRDPETNLSGW